MALRLGRPARLRRSSSWRTRSEEHTSELQSQSNLVCRLLLEKKKEQEFSTLQFFSHSRLFSAFPTCLTIPLWSISYFFRLSLARRSSLTLFYHSLQVRSAVAL